MARSPCGNTAAVASNATAAVAFQARRRKAGNVEINDTGAQTPMLPAILPPRRGSFNRSSAGWFRWALKLALLRFYLHPSWVPYLMNSPLSPLRAVTKLKCYFA